MGPWITDEIEVEKGGGGVGADGGVLDAEEEADGPEEVEEGDRDEEPAEMGAGGEALGGESEGVMTQEHGASLGELKIEN
jgi:hypothetical protein